MCDVCLTRRETKEASALKDQIEALTEKVNMLVSEFKTIKEQKQVVEATSSDSQPWSDTARVKKMKSSLCIKSNGSEVDLEKMQEIAANNSIQVTKTTVKENGDVYVDLPSVENREKLTPLLNQEVFENHSVIKLKSKLPTISILDVKEFSSKDDFVEKIKKQNPEIRQLIEGGSEFSIVYSKKPNETNGFENKHCQIVPQVGEEI